MYKFLISLAYGVCLNAQMVSGVSILVKDKAITLYEIEQKMQSLNTSLEIAAQALIRQKLEEIEVATRKITVSSTEIYDDIKETAKRNAMSVNDFYEAALNAKGINSTDLKKKVKQKLLSEKLYSSIAYSKLMPHSQSELQEYYQLHKSVFFHPKSFTVTIYQTTDKESLLQKITNPMLYTPQIQEIEQILPYKRISLELAQVLAKTAVYTFTPILPNAKGGYMSLFVKEIEGSQEISFESVKEEVQNIMYAKKREQILGDYFKRLRDNADIKILRNPS